MRIADHEVSKESIGVQDFVQNVKDVLNNGNVEVEITNAGEPQYQAPSTTKLVVSFFGAQYRLYISYNSNWYYTTLTKLV